MEIGEKIKEKRCEIGLTQTELGKRMGVTRSNICKVEKGSEANLTIDRIKAFADVLGCSIYDLIGEKPTVSEDKQTDFIEFRRGRRRYFVLRKSIVTVEECEGQTFCAICVANDTGCFLVDGDYDEIVRKIKGGE